MNYPNGEKAHIGDFVGLGGDVGRVVCSIDDNEYGPDHDYAHWGYLGHGVMIEFPRFGLIHYVEPKPDLVFISRG